MKDGERINQITFMRDPWTHTTICGLACVGRRRGSVEAGKGQKSGNNCNSINNKNKTKKRETERCPIY